MNETTEVLKIGAAVRDFDIETYEPVKGDFGTFSLSEQKSNNKWTILFFYPADFTFV
jgi:peroxiredoxin (alkyl hydroperoxide reductase subunit C)